MKLHEKIYWCRKKVGLSQEALAERIGVSRQAVSKWETGEAVPEVGKLLLLAKTFGVTTDWLLSEDPPAEDNCRQDSDAPPPPPPEKEYKHYPDWMDNLPGTLGRMVRRFGWLYGIYVALGGLGFTVIGAVARVISRRMFANSIFDTMSGFMSSAGDMYYYGDAYSYIGDSFSGVLNAAAMRNPVYTMGTVIMVIGIVIMIAGVVLAIFLKQKSKK
ncbi:MAG: helix-turn-helix transcriptional regulator [Oscillospiraceae bacterium]|nr:helix-turn-helix transcriptional regulator [Oscillospiraceae bacterium]